MVRPLPARRAQAREARLRLRLRRQGLAPVALQAGHDARLKSVVMRVVRGEADPSSVPADGPTREYLMLAPWVTAEMARVIGL